jgi:hypothetical protein
MKIIEARQIWKCRPGEVGGVQRFVALLVAAEQVVLVDLTQQSGIQSFLAVFWPKVGRCSAKLLGPWPLRHRVECVQEATVRLHACKAVPFKETICSANPAILCSLETR